MAVRVLFAVDYNHKPFCMVRAGDFRSAVKNASGFLAMPLNGQAGYRDPTPDEVAKLTARRPTDGERYAFAVMQTQFGAGGEVELAAVPLGR
ncbi:MULTISPECIES: hypothetical protein [Paramagnetospirillum]|jgi:hypothetical protein|uniref:hypothetical protein n=1 Tax=Paramagnetospirillum TaxID=3031148 RepID=UPI0005971AC3|nr:MULTISPECIES: hypothetical protein [Paramagnetospirillum]